MKHWDLKPGERVTLRSNAAKKISGYFVSRDTCSALFMIDDDNPDTCRGRRFVLREDGGLEERVFPSAEQVGAINHGDYNSAEAVRIAKRRRIVWSIEGADRNTRFVASGLLLL